MVKVRLFARLKDLAKRETLTLSVNQPVSLKQFIESLSPSLPEVVSLVKDKRVLIAVNQEVATEETVIRDGDEIALMPPFSGGNSQLSTLNSQLSPQPWTRIQTEDFSLDDELRRIKTVSGRIGGVAIFVGTARDFSKGRQVSCLSYEHYAGLAERRLADIRRRALKQFGLIEVGIIHRTGEVPIGEKIVLIMAAAEHRDEAFRACRWCIDELKAIVPIWKKEITRGGDIWVEDRP